MQEFSVYNETAQFLRDKLNGFVPEIMMILGSGIGFIAQLCQEQVLSIDYKDIPNIKTSTVESHNGRLVFGSLNGRNVCIMDGRLHVYEGYTAEDSAFCVYVSKLLGVKKLITTNAAGGVNLEYKIGDLVMITDHIKLFSFTPLAGKNADKLGPRFCDMTYAYSKRLQLVVRQAAKSLDIDIKDGIYFYAPGPQFETPAEIHAIRALGGDVVGMSTVFEVIAAAHCGIETIGISLVTNMAAGIDTTPLDHVNVMHTANQVKDKFCALVIKCIEAM